MNDELLKVIMSLLGVPNKNLESLDKAKSIGPKMNLPRIIYKTPNPEHRQAVPPLLPTNGPFGRPLDRAFGRSP